MLAYTENEVEFAFYMEHLNQPTIISEKVLEYHSPISDEEEFKCYVIDILQALEYIHSRGVMHADVKLENFMGQ